MKAADLEGFGAQINFYCNFNTSLESMSEIFVFFFVCPYGFGIVYVSH